jgi:NAD(P)-dependent dehydrogenase (short-subunit alcohol dehydrogenase family)
MERRRRWTAADIPDQSDRTAVVTGANTGLGFETAMALARRGAAVILACRDLTKAKSAADRIRAAVGPERVRVVRLDLASLASVRDAAAEIRGVAGSLDLLINNAGVMDAPRRRTEDGFELTFAVNHLGHFALTGLLLDQLLSTPASRIVTVSSVAHRRCGIDLEDLRATGGFEVDDRYAQSKLANLLFTYELQSRLTDAGAETIALAAHPGNARTELWRSSSGIERMLLGRPLRILTFWLVQSASMGALATLRAATDPSARGGDYFGPSGRLQYTGRPTRVGSSPAAHDEAVRRRLWGLSEKLTGVSYPIPAPSG